MSHEGILLSCLPPERHSKCLEGHSHNRHHPVQNISHCLSRHHTESQVWTPGRLTHVALVSIVTLCLLSASCTLRVPCSQTTVSMSPSCHFPILTVIPTHTKLHHGDFQLFWERFQCPLCTPAHPCPPHASNDCRDFAKSFPPSIKIHT